MTVDDAPKEPSRRAEAWRWARWPVCIAAGALAAVVVFGAWLYVTTDLPPVGSAAESAVLLDRNGEELAVLAQDGLRIEVDLDDVAPAAVDALIAAEDRRFHEHRGVDPVGIARSVWNNLRDDDVEGGSTITQQLVKNVYLHSDRTITRKVREVLLAVKLERRSDKDAILERYLNSVYFGRGAYGIEAAARAYFSTGARDLSVSQAALLIGLLPSPEALDPVEAPQAATERRDQVLAAMVDTGALTPVEAASARSAPVEVIVGVSPTTLSAGVAPHFVERVRREVVGRFGERSLYERGLVVHTTLDVADQRAAEAAVAASLPRPDDPQAALVAVDAFGAIRAWVGGRDYGALQLDLISDEAGTGRQPGSTFKPVVLAANLEAGRGAGQRFDAPARITLHLPSGPWTVDNAGGGGYGRLSLAEATVRSVNTVYAQALAQVGPEAVVRLAGRLGVESPLEARPSIALGAEEVTPLDLVTVYSTFARSGTRIDPHAVTRIETRTGHVVFELELESSQAVEPRIADTVNAILSETPRRGTATRAALRRPMAAKTGTSQRNADAWLAGYTPTYTAIVWVGDAAGNEPMGAVAGERVSGGTIPAQIWKDFMAAALADVEPVGFPPPDPQLLSDRTVPPRITVSPPSIEAGQRFTVTGSGFGECLNGWYVEATGPTPFASAVEVASTESRRSADLRAPAAAAPGRYQVVARCNAGNGPRPKGDPVSLTVQGG